MAEQIISKICSKCKLVKPVENFHCNRAQPDGHDYWCKVCRAELGKGNKHKERTKRWRKSESGKAHIKASKQTENYKACEKRYREAHPDRMTARKSVIAAISRGDMPPARTLLCSCGEKADAYHHSNYAIEHQLDVVAKCRSCHNLIHNP